LKIKEISKKSEKLKTVREVRENSGNFAKFFGKLKFLPTLHNFGILLT